MPDLNQLRLQIDAIDDKLVELLNQRADLALGVKEAKSKDNIAVYAPERERQIIERVLAHSAGGSFPKGSLEKVFMNIISGTRSLIGELTIAYSGPQYSLAHSAALKQFGDSVRYSAEVSAEEVFLKVERDDAAYGVIEAQADSGAVPGKTIDLLMQFDLKVIAEIILTEGLSLITNAASLSSIKKVYADPYCLGKCNSWLRANLPAAELVVETSSASLLPRLNGDDAAFVGPAGFAEQLGLQSKAHGIEEEPIRQRFFVIGRKTPQPTGRDKTSLLCGGNDRAGLLRELLQPFAERQITLLNIDSRASRVKGTDYLFFIDLLGHAGEKRIEEAIAALGPKSSYLKVLGSYPAVTESP